jgi:hypothetical protein
MAKNQKATTKSTKAVKVPDNKSAKSVKITATVSPGTIPAVASSDTKHPVGLGSKFLAQSHAEHVVRAAMTKTPVSVFNGTHPANTVRGVEMPFARVENGGFFGFVSDKLAVFQKIGKKQAIVYHKVDTLWSFGGKIELKDTKKLVICASDAHVSIENALPDVTLRAPRTDKGKVVKGSFAKPKKAKGVKTPKSAKVAIVHVGLNGKSYAETTPAQVAPTK